MEMLEKLETKKCALAVVGLGYVGLPLAEAFSHCFHVIGFDVNEAKIAAYRAGHDATEELGDEVLKNSSIEFTSQEADLRRAAFIIIAVPTPINGDKTPDLTPVKSATELVARNLQPGAVVVYESTVYPGVTEEICQPILEGISGLKGGRDFKIGYSPERINPGDHEHRLKNIVKIVSGQDKETRGLIQGVYNKIVDRTYAASSIKVAEAAKLVENAQRDVNIAFMNELAMVFHRMDIDTKEVAAAMDTKWNALGFRPGLVGGHCIGVDPYYFIYQAENLGYHSQIIAAGRRINNGMSEFVAQEAFKMMILEKIDVSRANVYLFGMTFKGNCPDTRNSRSLDVYHFIEDYGIKPHAIDPLADRAAFAGEFKIQLAEREDVREADCLIFLADHEEFSRLSLGELKKQCRVQRGGSRPVLIDVKCIFSRVEAEDAGFRYWSL